MTTGSLYQDGREGCPAFSRLACEQSIFKKLFKRNCHKVNLLFSQKVHQSTTGQENWKHGANLTANPKAEVQSCVQAVSPHGEPVFLSLFSSRVSSYFITTEEIKRAMDPTRTGLGDSHICFTILLGSLHEHCYPLLAPSGCWNRREE